MGGVIIVKNEQNKIKLYLLGQLDEADAEQIELRLMSDPGFTEEFDTVVDDIADRYVEGEFDGDELARVERYFLSTRERRNKVRFVSELRRRAEAERGREIKAPVVEPGFFERVRAFFTEQPVFATALAMIVIVVGIAIWWAQQSSRPSGTYATINLTISSSDRATGSQTTPARLKPEDAGLRVELALPEQALQAKDYRVELLDQQESSRNLTVKERQPQSLLVEIPADELTRGPYIIHLHAVNPDGSERRIPGSYNFFIE